jgi:hypothetical protein
LLLVANQLLKFFSGWKQLVTEQNSGFGLLEVQKACRLLAAYPNGCCHWGRTQKPQSRPGSYDGDGRITRSVNFSGDWLGRFEIVLVTDVVSPDNQFM